jgi:hypothetical protein
MNLSASQYAILLLTAATLLLMFWRGRRPERIAGACLLVLMVGSGMVDRNPGWQLLLLSASAAAVLGWLSLAYTRWWLIFALGLQLLNVATHLVPLIDSDYRIWAAVTLRLAIWVGLMLLALFGVLESRYAPYARAA